jgi:hypothetical protein
MQHAKKTTGKTMGTRIGLSKSGNFHRMYSNAATLVPETNQRAKLK